MKFSILTPTYNRAHTLNRLFDSIAGQTIKGGNLYEWVIIDDGSTDETGALVDSFIALNCEFDIKYIFQPNAGKPSAINSGVLHASGEYIFIVDSDDMLPNYSIDLLIEADKFAKDKFEGKYSGFCFRKADLSGNILGTLLPNNNEQKLMSATDCGYTFKADLAYIFKRELLHSNIFPSFKNEKFVPELYIWNKITDINPVLVFPEKIIYWCEYLDDGLTKNFKAQLKNNPRGFLLFYRDQFIRERSFLAKFKKLVRAIQCYIYIYIK